MKSSELRLLSLGLASSIVEGSVEIKARLDQEAKYQAALEEQPYQVFVEAEGRLRETLASEAHRFLSEAAREDGHDVKVIFYAYVNSQLHPVEMTKEWTLIADTVTVYEPGGVVVDTDDTKG